jgi:hypothetical protein
VNIEFDFTEGKRNDTNLKTFKEVVNRPLNLSHERLSVIEVFRRAGFDVTATVKPLGLVGGRDHQWTDQELHDAMQFHWSRFAKKAQWAIWVIFASKYKKDALQCGVMFDHIGRQHRQGCAIFEEQAVEPGDHGSLATGDLSEPSKRNIFWVACHEIGHCFNLPHSWLTMGGVPWIGGWPDRAAEPKALSFMNYSSKYPGGAEEYLDHFEYRFSGRDHHHKGRDLLFMRHAPEGFVEPGDREDLVEGFRAGLVHHPINPKFDLKLRANREKPIFEFMEPITLELRLANSSSHHQIVDKNLLSMTESMTITIQKDGGRPRLFKPYARYCWVPRKKTLKPEERLYESLFVSAGLKGWYISEPGSYTIRVAIHARGEDIPSNPLRIRVEPPSGHDKKIQERLAQDFFSDDIGRIIALDGSRFLADRNRRILYEVIDKLKDRRVAFHTSVAVGIPLLNPYKQLAEVHSADRKTTRIEIKNADPEEGFKRLYAALVPRKETSVETFGHIDYRWYADHFSDWLYHSGNVDEAVKIQDTVYGIMSTRRVHGRPILNSVLRHILRRRNSYTPKHRKSFMVPKVEKPGRLSHLKSGSAEREVTHP